MTRLLIDGRGTKPRALPPAASGPGRRLGGGALLMAGALLTGGLNYLYSLALIRLLPAPEFAKVASLNSLLLIAGTVAAATIPWVVAREVSNSTARSARRRRAVSFALVASVSGGMLAAAVIALLQLRYTDPALLVLSGTAGVAIFVSSVAAGQLQGEQRFGRLVVFRLLEVTVKVATGLVLAYVTRSAVAGIAGFAVAAVGCALYGLWLVRAELSRPTLQAALGRDLWRHAAGIGSVQGAVALLQATDVIVLGLTVGNTTAVAGYQAMQVIGRTPVFLAGAVAIAVFPRLSREADTRRAWTLFRRSLRTYLIAAGALTLIIGLFPPGIARLIFPASYGVHHHLLLPVALAGFAAGLLTLLATWCQATDRYRLVLSLLGAGVLLTATVLAPMAADITRTAWATAGCLYALSAALWLLARGRQDRP
ncbi:lipopolysaccharide biosynthesis protein [Actinoplanes sp. NPDC048967]|uniref:lipopolysaccharide biosynthesis protein n=1 Tax=Actinoplanes sp. NPDC048967 TaxID=3155269 RepID=UPI0033FCEF49